MNNVLILPRAADAMQSDTSAHWMRQSMPPLCTCTYVFWQAANKVIHKLGIPGTVYYQESIL